MEMQYEAVFNASACVGAGQCIWHVCDLGGAGLPTLCEGLTLAIIPLSILPLTVIPLSVVVLSVLRQLPSCSMDIQTVSRRSPVRDATWNVHCTHSPWRVCYSAEL